MSIRRPFNSPAMCLLFIASIVIFLSLPMVLSIAGITTSRQMYKEVSPGVGPFHFFEKTIYQETGDIDVLILGPSLSWNAIDAKTIKDALTQRLGREAIVYNFGSNWRGEDLYYTLLRDVTKNRKVSLLIYSPPMPSVQRNDPHPKAQFWTAYGIELNQGKSLYRLIQNYSLEILGAPRHLLSAIRDDISHDTRGAVQNFGTLKTYSGLNGNFIEQKLAPPNFTSEQLLYSNKTSFNFKFQGSVLPDFIALYNQKLFELAKSKSIAIATIYLPLYSQRHDIFIEELINWRDFSNNPKLQMIGIPNQQLFKNLSEKQIDNMYYDQHLNVNGAIYFTKAILPSVLELYEQAIFSQ